MNPSPTTTILTAPLSDPISARTAEVLQRFNRAFLEHDPSLLADLIDPECTVERIQPTAEGTHLIGGPACLANWQSIASLREGNFELEEVVVTGERGFIFWEYTLAGRTQRGLNVMTVRDGRIVAGRGYGKSKSA
jgi:ketosteroid isomerase-like protein